MKFTQAQLSNFDFCRSLEWLETNGIGGYASSTVSGAHSRRYHGLLVAALQSSTVRTVLVSKLDECLVINQNRVELSANQYPNSIYPQGYQYLQSFERGLFPVFYYECQGVVLKKTVAAIQGENTTVILYEVLKAPNQFTLELQPFYSCRDSHSLSYTNTSIGQPYLFGNGVFQTSNYLGGNEFFISVPGSSFIENIDWYHKFEYSVEQERGLEFQEDLFTHGNFSLNLQSGSQIGIIISTQNPKQKNAFQLFKIEEKRRISVTKTFPKKNNLYLLALAADQFIVKQGQFKTTMPGYHWLTDWGRNTLISLPGLYLATNRFDDAKNILNTFTLSVNEHLLSTHFLEEEKKNEYSAADTSLWFFYTVYQYLRYTNDEEWVKSVLPFLKEIIECYQKGTRYHLQIDRTGLLSVVVDDDSNHWMNGQMSDTIIPSRKGQLVELNALWYNALCIMEKLLSLNGEKKLAKEYQLKSRLAKESFLTFFWYKEGEYLVDHIFDKQVCKDFRPHQLYAIALPFPLLDKIQAQRMMNHITEQLLTPRGLRSLSPLHSQYKARYGGDIWQRDAAYHQGSVWGFLLGIYIDGLYYINEKDTQKRASKLILTFLGHLHEAGVGTISEIFDGTAPHKPRGCVAHALSVAEILRVITEYHLLGRKTL